MLPTVITQHTVLLWWRALQYVMYFQFIRWRHVFTYWLCGMSSIHKQWTNLTVITAEIPATYKDHQLLIASYAAGAKFAVYDCLVVVMWRYLTYRRRWVSSRDKLVSVCVDTSLVQRWYRNIFTFQSATSPATYRTHWDLTATVTHTHTHTHTQRYM